MQIAISYFAQLRNFKHNMIPVSTAMWDPKWYHDNRGPKHIFYDKKGVLNGARCELLVPGKDLIGLCGGKSVCELNPRNCPFLTKYSEQLSRIDFKVMLNYLERMEEWAVTYTNIPKEDIVLVFMVYEKYDNPCSERAAIINYFHRYDIDIQELQYSIK